ncbi:serine hydrolase domain-containing protein [Microbacterium sp. SS28]|uniref:serine hydrolase domain-containing protein n=1 Tax=Microbacterium sp. SS28 TaxID=2919948 RepID=UPI0027E107B4|nr:serine hydrolase domain-containing protein [Microbacterium sp. SS28]
MPAQVDADFSTETVDQLQAAAAHAMAAAGAPGAIVGVWAPWSGEWVAGLGTQKPAGAGSAVSTDQQFKAAQVTRAMTCDVLYRLAGQGVVALDDPVTKYVTGVADMSEVTLGELCDGTAGIGSYSGQLLSTWLSMPERVWNPRELASYGLGLARTQPGTAFRDSDAGYVLLGLALEHASDSTAAELISEQVATPLGLSATRLPADGAELPSSMLAGYLSQRDAAGAANCAEPLDITKLSTSTGYTDAGVVTDIRDLGRYAQALAADALVPADTDRLDGALPAYDGAPAWYTTRGGVYQAGSLIGQSGAVPGYATAAFADPASGLTVAVVLNNSAAGSGMALALAWELAAIASKAPAAPGQTAPEAGLPWTAQQYHDAITGSAICPIP